MEETQSGFSKFMCKYVNFGGINYTAAAASATGAGFLLNNPESPLEVAAGCACAVVSVTLTVLGVLHSYVYVLADKDKRYKWQGIVGLVTSDEKLFE